MATKVSFLLSSLRLYRCSVSIFKPKTSSRSTFLLTDITQEVVENTNRFTSWKIILLDGIAEANGWQSFRSNYTGNMILIGNRGSLIVCQHLYEYLSKTIERRAKYRKGRGRAYLNAFRVGCATRLSERLLLQRQEMEQSGISGNSSTPATSAIVVRSMFAKSAEAIEQYLRSQGIKVKEQSCQTSSKLGFQSGYQVGDKISLDQQVQSAERTVPQLPYNWLAQSK